VRQGGLAVRDGVAKVHEWWRWGWLWVRGVSVRGDVTRESRASGELAVREVLDDWGLACGVGLGLLGAGAGESGPLAPAWLHGQLHLIPHQQPQPQPGRGTGSSSSRSRSRSGSECGCGVVQLRAGRGDGKRLTRLGMAAAQFPGWMVGVGRGSVMLLSGRGRLR
jgi:hypothetical protein